MGSLPRTFPIAFLVALLFAPPSPGPAPAFADGPQRLNLQLPPLVPPPDVPSEPTDANVPEGSYTLLALAAPAAGPSAGASLAGARGARAPLRQGSWEAGAILAYSISGAGGPNIGAVVRAFWLLPRVGYSFWEMPWYPGSFQIFLEPAGAFITTPAKTYLLGVNAILRHTFLWRPVSPYIEGGAGLLNTNLRTRALGESIEFMPQVGAGVHLHVAERVSLNAGYRWTHISNAGLAERNLGINSHFPYLGFTYFF